MVCSRPTIALRRAGFRRRVRSLQESPGKRAKNAAKGGNVSDQPQRDDGRMEFLLNLRRRGIMDQAVLRAMDEVPRARFVPAEFEAQAQADRALPIACGQTISQPYVVAYMTEQLELAPASPRARGRHRLGLSGGGLVAAGARGRQHRALSHAGRRRARAACSPRLRQCRSGGGRRSRRRAGSARRSTASSSPPPPSACPQTLLDQLADDGIMVLPLGAQQGPQHIVKLTKSQTGIAREDLIPVRFVPLMQGQAQEL